MDVRKTPIKPFLKWAGGKRRLLPYLLACTPVEYNTYYEPFLGSGAHLLALQPARAAINDSSSELINCYHAVRNNIEDLIIALARFTYDRATYYAVRAWDREIDYVERDPIERAARLIYLNKTGYNGLYRVNARGHFNVPFGRYTRPTIVDKINLHMASDYLNACDLIMTHTDFVQAIATAAAGDFIYFDPPYDPVSPTASFTAYAPAKFGRVEQRRLREVVDELHRRGCYVMISNAYTEFIEELYQDLYCQRIPVPRIISSRASSRGSVDEILATTYPITPHLLKPNELGNATHIP
jgi:DNA adenine methylase